MKWVQNGNDINAKKPTIITRTRKNEQWSPPKRQGTQMTQIHIDSIRLNKDEMDRTLTGTSNKAYIPIADGYWNKKAQTFHKYANIKEPSQDYNKEKSNGIYSNAQCWK